METSFQVIRKSSIGIQNSRVESTFPDIHVAQTFLQNEETIARNLNSDNIESKRKLEERTSLTDGSRNMARSVLSPSYSASRDSNSAEFFDLNRTFSKRLWPGGRIPYKLSKAFSMETMFMFTTKYFIGHVFFR